MKNKTTQGLGNKNLLSFPKHDSKIKKQCQQSYVNTICNLHHLSGGKWCLQRKYMCRQHVTLHCRKLHKQFNIKRTYTCRKKTSMSFIYFKMVTAASKLK
jgi:hypothetical protein